MRGMEQPGIHRECAAFEARDDPLRTRAVARRAPGHVEWQEMLLGGMRPRRFGRLLAIVDERCRVVRKQPLLQPVREHMRVTQWLVAARVREPVAQIVRRVARAHDQHAVVGERRERASQRDMVQRTQRRLH